MKKIIIVIALMVFYVDYSDKTKEGKTTDLLGLIGTNTSNLSILIGYIRSSLEKNV